MAMVLPPQPHSEVLTPKKCLAQCVSDSKVVLRYSICLINAVCTVAAGGGSVTVSSSLDLVNHRDRY